MGRLAFVASIVALALGQAPPALAATEHSYYTLEWNGISLGRIRFDVEDTTYTYSATFDAKSKGVASAFSPFRTLSSVKGRHEADDYIPQEFKDYDRDEDCDDCDDTLRYDETGTVTTRDIRPPEDPSWRPTVSTQQVARAVDPLTAYLKIRKALRANVDEGIRETRIRAYDGKRLAEYTIIAVQRTPIFLGENRVPAIHAVLKRNPIDGYTPKEWKKFKKGDPTIYLKFSDDEKMQLLKLDFKTTFGQITMQLADEPK